MLTRRSLLAGLAGAAAPKPKPRKAPPVVWSNQASDTLTFPPGATTGQRITIDANGIRAYDTSNHLVWELDATTFLGLATSSFIWQPNKMQVLWDGDAAPGGLTIGAALQEFLEWMGPLGAGTGSALMLMLAGVAGQPGAIQFGQHGIPGAPYSEELSMPAQNIPNNAVTQLTNLVSQQLHSDYGGGGGSAWNLATGVWTCPADSDYDFSLYTIYTGGAVNARTFLRMGTVFNTAPFLFADDRIAPAIGMGCIAHASRFIVAGTQLHIEVFQNSGAAHTLDSTQCFVNIARRVNG